MYELTRMLSELVPLLCVLGVCGFPAGLAGLHLLTEHRERMRVLEEKLARASSTMALDAEALDQRIQALEALLAGRPSWRELPSQPAPNGAHF